MRSIIFCLAVIMLATTLHAQSVTPRLASQQAVENKVARTSASFFRTPALRIAQLNADPCGPALSCYRAPLPVKLISFTGKRIDNQTVTLFWETSQEQQNEYFEIERTLNPASGFQTVGKVKGALNSSSSVKYSSADLNGMSGYSYYRLKQVDTDGSFAYSSIVAVTGANIPLTVLPMPNPGRVKEIIFRLNGLVEEQTLMITLFNVSGKQVYAHKIEKASPELQALKLELPDLPIGKYSIRVESQGKKAVSSFVVLP